MWRRTASAVAVLVCGLAFADCSGHASSKETSPVMPLSPQQTARNYAQAIVDATNVPRGAQPYRGPLPVILQTPFGGIIGENVVHAPPRIWTVPVPASSLRTFDFTPSDYTLVPNNGGTVGIPGRREKALAFGAGSSEGLPLNVATAQLDVKVTDDGHGGSIIRADGLASWTPPKSAAEYVPSVDHVATITTSHANVLRRIVVTDPARFAALAASLNRMPLETIGTWSECGLNPDPALYVAEPSGERVTSVAFSHDARSKPNLIVWAPTCYAIGVRAAGKEQPALQIDDTFSQFLGEALTARA